MRIEIADTAVDTVGEIIMSNVIDDDENDDEHEQVKERMEALSNLLDCVILNRNKRKAKQIVKVGVEFILAVWALLITVLSDRGLKTDPDAIALAIMAMAYAVGLMISVTIHACCLLRSRMETCSEIEEAYEKTNAVPFFDSILEIPLAWRFGGKRVVCGLWFMFLLFFLRLLVTLASSKHSQPYVISCLLASITMYNMTSDLCEYWVFTRPQNLRRQEEEKNVVEQSQVAGVSDKV